MKIYHSGSRNISDKAVLDSIAKSIYSIGSENIKENYKIHVNFVNNSYFISIEPKSNDIPVIKLNTFIIPGDKEILRIVPTSLTFAKSISLDDNETCMQKCSTYIDIFDFISSLYDYEYEL